MSEIVLQINDDMSLDQMVALLAPYSAKAEIKQTTAESMHKIWTGRLNGLMPL
ncbi:MAG: hypothetical protein LBI90_02180 [Treponema sp.]|jgi:hypothetical protein|nr:hypothetical protein [Treponema sp.]